MKQKMDLKEIVLGTILAVSLTAGIGGIAYITQDCNSTNARDTIYEPETQNRDKTDYEPAIDIPVYLLF